MQGVVMSYEIFTDVSVDIDMDFADAHHLHYISMNYSLGEEHHHCDRPESDEMMHTYYQRLREKISTQTSQIIPYHYVEAFEPYVKKGCSILYMSLSSGLSNTYESACMAAAQLKETYPDVTIEIVDSLGATGGMGLLAESACLNRDEKGMSIEENAAWLREYSHRIHFWFKVEDLMYLSRGGRISTAAALMGTALKLKPILTINKTGKLDTIDKKRGNRLAFKRLLDLFEAHYQPGIYDTVYICCADCKKDAETLRDMVLEKHPELTVRITMLSPIIGAHTGPDMLALIHYGDIKEY